MKKIIDFMEENVDGRTLFTKELVYELEMAHCRAYTLTRYPFLI